MEPFRMPSVHYVKPAVADDDYRLRIARAHVERMRIINTPMPWPSILNPSRVIEKMPWAGTIIGDNFPTAAVVTEGKVRGKRTLPVSELVNARVNV